MLNQKDSVGTMVARVWMEERNESYCLIGRELPWYKMKRVTGIDSGDEGTRM